MFLSGFVKDMAQEDLKSANWEETVLDTSLSVFLGGMLSFSHFKELHF